MKQPGCVTSPVRSPRLVGVVVAVLALHGVLLYRWRMFPPMPTSASETVRQGGLQLSLHLPVAAQAATPAVVQLPPVQPETPVPVSPTANAAQPASQPKAVSGAQQSAAASQATPLAVGPSASRDGQTVLDFQLADIQGGRVQLGVLQLGLHVQAGHYEAQSRWTLGASQGTAVSEGAIAQSLRPTSYRETGRHTVDDLLPAGAQDLLSLIWTLRNLVAALPAQLPDNPAPEWQLPVLTDGSVQTMRWRLVQEDGLMLPGGTLRAAKLAGTVDNDPLNRINIWFALDFDHLPVRLEKTFANGQVLDAKVSTNVQATFARTFKSP